MRSSPLIEYSSTVLLLCLWLGAITTVFSSLIGLFQQDIKKVIAYSTMSQLGMMVIAVGLSSYNIALFHLVNHAFYKALLFLGAGAVIHAVADNQDFRKYGGLKQFLPLTYSVMLIASLSLVAFPFMTGFYSKDFILESAFGQFYFSSVVVYFLATIGAMFTTLYSVKVLYLTFLANPNGPLSNYKMAHEGDLFMNIPLILLAFFSIYFGYFTKDIFIGLGSSFFVDNSLFIHPNHEIMMDTEFAVPTLFKLLPLFFTVGLGIISIIISEVYHKPLLLFKLSRLGYNTFSFFNQRFYVELFYNKYITEATLNMGSLTTKVLDKGSVEFIGPFGLEKGLNFLSKSISKMDTGVITTYALYILVGLVTYTTIPFIGNYNLIIIILVGLISLSSLINLNKNSACAQLKFNSHLQSMPVFNKNLLLSIFSCLCMLLGIGFITKVFLSLSLFGLSYSLCLAFLAFTTGFLAYIFKQSFKLKIVNYKLGFLLATFSFISTFLLHQLYISISLDSFIYVASVLGVFKLFKCLGINFTDLSSILTITSPSSKGTAYCWDNIPSAKPGIEYRPGQRPYIPGRPGGPGENDTTVYPDAPLDSASRNGVHTRPWGTVRSHGIEKGKGALWTDLKPATPIPEREFDMSDPQQQQVARELAAGLKSIADAQGTRPGIPNCLAPEVAPWVEKYRQNVLGHNTRFTTTSKDRFLNGLERPDSVRRPPR